MRCEMREAYKAAAKSRMMWRVGAVVAKKGKILAKGYNRNYSSPSYLPHGERYYHTPKGIEYRFSIHAEWDALRKLDPEEARGAEIYTAGLNMYGKLIASGPCEECRKVLEMYGIKRAHEYRRWVRQKEKEN